MDCSPPGSSVHGILQARILEWVAISFHTHSEQELLSNIGALRNIFVMLMRNEMQKIFFQGSNHP